MISNRAYLFLHFVFSLVNHTTVFSVLLSIRLIVAELHPDLILTAYAVMNHSALEMRAVSVQLGNDY